MNEEGQTVTATFPPSWLHVVRGPRMLIDQAAAQYPRAKLIINSVMFVSRQGTDVVALRDAKYGLDVAGSTPDAGATIWVDGGRAGGRYGGSFPPTASVVIQGWPSLVADGRVTATNVGTNAERDTRAGIGVTDAGLIVIVYVVGTMVDLAEAMVRSGAIVAGYLDGGSSSQLRTSGGVRRDSRRVAPIPGWILAEPPAITVGRQLPVAILFLLTAGALGYALWPDRPSGVGMRAGV